MLLPFRIFSSGDELDEGKIADSVLFDGVFRDGGDESF